MPNFFRFYGFSLIELMIVISIIAILTVIAIPSYNTYVKRARFTEVIVATNPFKTAVALALQEGISLNELFNNKHGIPDSPKKTKNLANIKVEKGTITAIATELADHATYILKPSSDGIEWVISGTCIKSGLCND